MRSVKYFFAFVGLGLLSACGFHFKRPEAKLPQYQTGLALKKQSIFVPLVDNETSSTGYEGILTNKIRSELGQFKGIHLENTRGKAQYELRVKIQKLARASGELPVVGTNLTEAAGGLLEDKISAGYSQVQIGIQAKLLQRDRNSPSQFHLVWEGNVKDKFQYELSKRFTEDQGSSSAPNINLSRERIIFDSFATDIAKELSSQIVRIY